MNLSDAYNDRELWFRDEYDRATDERVVYAMKHGQTGVGRGPWPDATHLATQRAIDDLEAKMA